MVAPCAPVADLDSLGHTAHAACSAVVVVVVVGGGDGGDVNLKLHPFAGQAGCSHGVVDAVLMLVGQLATAGQSRGAALGGFRYGPHGIGLHQTCANRPDGRIA